jgi:hypothetical protein
MPRVPKELIEHELVGLIYPEYHGQPLLPKVLDMSSSLQWQMTGEPYTQYQETNPPLQGEAEGPLI